MTERFRTIYRNVILPLQIDNALATQDGWSVGVAVVKSMER